MKKHYLIDGNNLIGKIPSLFNIQKRNPQMARQGLLNQLNRAFAGKKVNITLFLDGFEKDVLSHPGIKISYSNKRTADDSIRDFISASDSTSNLILVSSDGSLGQFAKKCACDLILSSALKSEFR